MDFWWSVGAGSAAVSVLLNHLMRWRNIEYGSMEDMHIVTWYQLMHSIGIMVASGPGGTRPAPVAAALMGAGLLLFSGSSYLIALTQKGWLFFVPPVGLLACLAGWPALALRK